jgi:hypothetical protein
LFENGKPEATKPGSRYRNILRKWEDGVYKGMALVSLLS